MKFSKIVVIGIVVVIAGISYFSLSTGSSDEEYIAALKEERKEKDEFMKSSEDSPFGSQKDSVSALKYFDPDLRYRVTARLLPIENKSVLILPTSKGEENKYLQYAWAEFEIDGVPCKLMLLEVMAMGPTRGTLFLAFADETSARETYGAGRYLDLKKVHGASTIVLDFNKAYNPYCAYVDSYSCPFPPRENFLKVEIKAGEKAYH